MFIKKIKLNNIRSYTNQEIEFKNGVTLLAGDIGAGKTTILLAMEFALFGLSKSDLSGKSLLRHGKKKGYVELDFSVGNKDVTIKRTLKRVSDSVVQDSGYIAINGKEEELTAEELKVRILKLLGYPRELLRRKNYLFRFTVYTPQEEMKRIIYDDEEVRLSTLRKIFQIEKYKTIRENTLIVIRALKQKVKFMKEEIKDFKIDEEEIEQLEKKRELNRKEIEEKNEIQNKLLKDMSELEARIKDYEAKIDEIRKLENKKELVVGEIKNLKDIMIEIVEEIKQNKEKALTMIKELTSITIADDVNPVSRIKDEIEHLNSEIADNEKKISRLNERIKHLKEKKQEIKESIQEMNEKVKIIPQLKSEIEKLESEHKKFLADEKELESEKQKHEMLAVKEKEILIKISEHKQRVKDVDSDVCPVCRQRISEAYRRSIISSEQKILKELKDELETVRKEIKENDARIKKLLTSNYDEVVRLLEKKSSELSDMKELQKDIKEAREKLKEIEKEIKVYEKETSLIKNDKLRDRLKELNKKLEHALVIEEKRKRKAVLKKAILDLKARANELKRKYANAKESIKTKQRMLDDLKKQLVNSSDVKKELDNLYLKQKELEQEERRISNSILVLKTNNANIEEKIEELIKRQNIIQEKKKELEHKEKLIQWLSQFFIPLSEEIERAVMLKIYFEFNELFVQWFQMLVDDENLEARLDDNFSLLIVQNGYETTINNLSGGEKTSLALAYRLALNKVINNLISRINTRDLIILDEPTDGFSGEQLDNVRTVLNELGLRQIIIVSHEAKIESFADNIIRVTKHDGKSEVC